MYIVSLVCLVAAFDLDFCLFALLWMGLLFVGSVSVFVLLCCCIL